MAAACGDPECAGVAQQAGGHRPLKNASQHLKTDELVPVLLAGSHLRRKVAAKVTTRAAKERARGHPKARARAAVYQRSSLTFRRVRRRTRPCFIQSFTTNNCSSIFRRRTARTFPQTVSGSTPARGVVAASRMTIAFVWQIVSSTTERRLCCQLIPRNGRPLLIWAWRLLLL